MIFSPLKGRQGADWEMLGAGWDRGAQGCLLGLCVLQGMKWALEEQKSQDGQTNSGSQRRWGCCGIFQVTVGGSGLASRE